MEANGAVWNSHIWNDRLIEIEPGLPLIQHACRPCGRNFVDERLTDSRYAVHVGVARFNRLSDETTAHWLTDVCPGECLIGDDADRKTRFLSLGFIAAREITPPDIAIPIKRSAPRMRVVRRPSPDSGLSSIAIAQQKKALALATRVAI